MKDLSKYFQKLPLKVVGVGITAFNRVGPAFFLPDYEIICYKNSWDVGEIKKKCRVRTIQDDFGSDLKRLNSLAILRNPGVQKYLRNFGKVGLFLYKSTAKIEKLADKFGWQILTNRAVVRDPYENKKIFREVLEKVGIKPISARTILLKDFNEKIFVECQQEFGSKLVLQLPEVTKGGGRGNTFIRQPQDLPKFWQKVKQLGESFDLQHVIIAKFIESISPSITGCVTRNGVLTGVVQTQITDIPEVINLQKGSGLFVGHDWSYRNYAPKIQRQADNIAKSFGSYLAKRGYKGIFGLDLLVEKETEKVFACECNPRYTGAFPVYSMIQNKLGEPSFDIFHLLEHLNIDYQLDFKKVDQQYKQPKKGAHLILYNKTNDYLEVGQGLKAGVYKLLAATCPQSLRSKRCRRGRYPLDARIRPGFAFEDIKNNDEFVITDGAPRQGDIIRPGLRILKILFPRAILTKDGKAIDKRTKRIVKEIYQRLELKKPVDKKLLGCLRSEGKFLG